MSLPSRRGGYTRRLSGRRVEARGEEAAAALAGFAPGRYQLHYPVGTACCRACNLRAAPSSAAPFVGTAAPGQAALMVEARLVEGVAWLRTSGGGWVRQWVHQPGGGGLLEGGLKEYGWHRCEERPQQVGEGRPPGCVEDECCGRRAFVRAHRGFTMLGGRRRAIHPCPSFWCASEAVQQNQSQVCSAWCTCRRRTTLNRPSLPRQAPAAQPPTSAARP